MILVFKVHKIYSIMKIRPQLRKTQIEQSINLCNNMIYIVLEQFFKQLQGTNAIGVFTFNIINELSRLLTIKYCPYSDNQSLVVKQKRKACYSTLKRNLFASKLGIVNEHHLRFVLFASEHNLVDPFVLGCVAPNLHVNILRLFSCLKQCLVLVLNIGLILL